MRRRIFIRFLAGAAGGAALALSSRAMGELPQPEPPLRVRLFAGTDITRLEIAGIVLDAPSRSFSTPSGSKALGSGVVELTGNPYLDVTAVTESGARLARRYSGPLFVQLHGDSLLIVNHVDVETYVASVMSAEVSAGWPAESLRAQAIAVRTYAAHSRLEHATHEYDLNDDTSSQVYPGIAAMSQNYVNAAHDTAYTILTFGNGPASVFYASSCGGHTAAAIELTGLPSPQYLQGVPDVDPRGRAYCGAAPYFRWKNTVTAAAMARIVDSSATQLSSISVTERWPDGRVKTVTASTASVEVTLGGHEFYSRALRMLGYKVIPSTLFDIARDGQDFALVGHGVGHGVGMCQWGARGRAEAGMTANEILAAYFPGARISAERSSLLDRP